jgi:hypothetical protein
MNVKQHISDDAAKAGSVLHLTLREGEARSLPEIPGKLTERMMEEISMRATVVGPVLEAILHEQHGQPRWGLNE